ncbi:NUDIX domain-containing protein [Aliarcobacter vitoriensis]|uniref:NUDIX domain-containing protein n=1 Tax=Aliarcobacter vitoriensis TaxID=2011099 RepID=A0A366MSG7_9BACT|nr:NUDIX domain-containing protein [Aliarcobacter vitoriensis]RBQ29185.1 NUDIX domain-containing protein [Aliarcobacter vitoriensis]
MRYVVGIITDGKKVLLLKKNNPDWQKGLYNAVGGKVELESTPLQTIIKDCKDKIGLDIINWKELDSLLLPNGIDLTYFFAILEENDINKAQSLTDERVELFDINNLPKNILKDLKMQIDKIFFKIEKKDSISKKLFIFIVTILFVLFSSLMLLGKVQKGNFLYYLTEEKKDEDIDKKVQFKKGFNERIFGK